MPYELFIALRHLKSRRRQSLISISAIGIAVTILVISNAFMAGFTEEIYDVTVENLPHVVVTPAEEEEYIHFYNSIIPRIEGIEGVVGTSPALDGEATLQYKEQTLNVLMRGIEPEKEDSVSHISEDMIEGDLYKLIHSKNTIVIGDSLAEELDVKIGDKLSVNFPTANPASYEIVGIFDTGTPADDILTYTSLKTAQAFYDSGDAINVINIRLADYNEDKKVAKEIEALGYEASGWTETNPEILQTITIETTSNNIILALILLIASFGVVSTLNMVVMEKVKEIGVLMAMGAPASVIRRIFILESGILGLIGAVTGCLLGTAIALAIGSYPVPAEFYGIEKIPVIINISDIIITVVVVFFLNLIAGVYPAQRAAGLDPLEAISTH
ncbi:ABC transporter substrate-binding protein [Methanococcoides methylutens]|uniref:ABC transporter substrate-binding protein n=1 Tax=Methanococcoides methylutens TaxID=2226 RepID=A0A099T221_METMT|nr:ABC transporter permease [Methanococcoides methylutens]KGK98193.1 ABC transporter substrate-binding protein [Methanococcoides methylutens]